MRRRTVLAAVGTAGVVGMTGCSSLRQPKPTLADPTVQTDSKTRQTLTFTTDGAEIGSLGVTGTALTDVIRLETELWHQADTTVTDMTYRMWMPPTESDATATVGVVGPLGAGRSDPPSLAVTSARDAPGTQIEITDLGDLADDTIRTAFLVEPPADTDAALNIDAAIELDSDHWLTRGYTLTGQLQLEFPTLVRDGTPSES